MTRNSLAPGFIRVFYSTLFAAVPMQHRMTVPVYPNPGTLGGWELFTAANSLINWNSGTDALVLVMKALLHTSASIQYAELWTQEDENSEPVYRENYDITVAGTNATATVRASQRVWSFRSTNNGRMKFTLLETSQPVDQRVVYSALGAADKAIADYLLSAPSIVRARDGGTAQSFAFLTSKTNDALRRHRLNL